MKRAILLFLTLIFLVVFGVVFLQKTLIQKAEPEKDLQDKLSQGVALPAEENPSVLSRAAVGQFRPVGRERLLSGSQALQALSPYAPKQAPRAMLWQEFEDRGTSYNLSVAVLEYTSRMLSLRACRDLVSRYPNSRGSVSHLQKEVRLEARCNPPLMIWLKTNGPTAMARQVLQNIGEEVKHEAFAFEHAEVVEKLQNRQLHFGGFTSQKAFSGRFINQKDYIFLPLEEYRHLLETHPHRRMSYAQKSVMRIFQRQGEEVLYAGEYRDYALIADFYSVHPNFRERMEIVQTLGKDSSNAQ